MSLTCLENLLYSTVDFVLQFTRKDLDWAMISRAVWGTLECSSHHHIKILCPQLRLHHPTAQVLFSRSTSHLRFLFLLASTHIISTPWVLQWVWKLSDKAGTNAWVFLWRTEGREQRGHVCILGAVGQDPLRLLGLCSSWRCWTQYIPLKHTYFINR